MFNRKGQKCNHWDSNIQDVFCESCGKKLNRGSTSRVCIQCYKEEYTPLWKGGISSFPYSDGFNSKLKRQIKKRYDFQCQSPFCKKKVQKYLCVHHIDYNKCNHSNFNLISLCNICHPTTNSNRLFWKDMFLNIMGEKIMGKFND